MPTSPPAGATDLGLPTAVLPGLPQQILGQVPAAVATLMGPEHHYSYFNDGYQALAGNRAQLGLRMADVFPEVVEQGFLQLLDEVYATGVPHVGIETPVRLYAPRTGQSELRYMDFNYQPLLGPQGQPEGILVFVVDATEKVLARERNIALQAEMLATTRQQQQEHEKMYQIFGHTPAAICIQRGPEHRYEYLNPAYQQLFPDRQFLGRTVAEALPETVDGGFVALLDEVYRTGTTYFGYEALLTLAAPAGGPGRQMYFTFTYQAYREAGTIVGISTFAYDVSEQVRARQRQETQQRQMHELFEQTPVAVAVLRGPTYVIETANPAVCAMWGRTPAQALGTPLFDLLPEVTGQGFEELLEEVMATGVPFVAQELPSLIDRQGRRQIVYWSFVYQPLREADGLITGITVMATDVSEQVLARQQVQNLNQQLAAANTALSTTNAELGTQNAELRRTQHHLQQLNKKLDARVAERSQAALAARAEAEQQRARLERLFMAAPAAICILSGPDLVYELANPIYQQWLPGRQLLGRTVLAAVPEVAAQSAYEALRRVYDTGTPFYSPAQLVPLARPTDGVLEDRYFNLVFQARYDEHGGIDGVLVFGLEVTEQVLARAAIERQRQALYTLFMEAPTPVVVLDGPALVFELVNPAYQQIFPGRALLGKALVAALPELASTPIPTLLGHCYQTGEPYTAQEMPLLMARHEGGALEEIYWTFTYQARRTPTGTVDGVMVFAQDVTAQVQARQQVLGLNQQLAALNDKLYAANAALGHANDELGDANEALGDTNQQLTRINVELDTFVYTASHDLKGPITNIEGLVQALREELPPASQVGQVAHVLRLLQDSVDRFQHTIGHLTTIAHLQHELGQPLPPVRLADVIRDVRLDLAPLLAKTGGELTVDVQACDTLPFAEKNLHSVLYNLLSNALKYRHPDRVPQVRVRCRPEELYWALEVEDNGLGLRITPGQPLFGLFQRFHNHVEGSGVGLYMVKKMVENAGGRIEVRSELGVGSTFTVYLRR